MYRAAGYVHEAQTFAKFVNGGSTHKKFSKFFK